MSVGLKLSLAFGAVLLVMLALGLLSISSIGRVNEAGQAIRREWLPATELAGALADAVNSVRQAESYMMLSTDDDGRDDARKDVAASRLRVEDEVRQLRELPTTKETQGYVDDFKKSWVAYLDIDRRLSDLAAGDTHAEAVDLFTDGSMSDFRRVKTLLGRVLAAELKGSGDAVAGADQIYREVVPILGGAALFGALLCAAAMAGVFVWIGNPIRKTARVIASLAAGDLGVAIAASDRQDEIGALNRAVDVFRTGLIKTRDVERAQEVERHAKVMRQDATERLTSAFGETMSEALKGLSDASARMRNAATRMQSDASLTQERASHSVDRARDATTNLRTVSASTDAMSESVAEIGRQLANAIEIAESAVRAADATDAKVEELAQNAERIRRIVTLISSIAGQTNLLALNATIEAARAGEAGKGFAVVAGEVKVLASQTAQATNEISGQIESIRGATDEAVKSVHDVGQTIARVNDVAAAIAATVEEQNVATSGIAASVRQVTESTVEATEAIGQVSSIAEHAMATSRDVMTAAEEVARVATMLREEVDRFFAAVGTEDQPSAPESSYGMRAAA